MSKLTPQKIINKVVDETVDTIIDKIDEVLVDYMYEYGDYGESDNKFFDEKGEMFGFVIEELYNRINSSK